MDLCSYNTAFTSIMRGTLGGSEHRNTAEKFAKYRNIAKKKKKNCQIPQYYNTVSKLDVARKPLHCTLSLEQITLKQKLIFGNVRLRQNK